MSKRIWLVFSFTQIIGVLCSWTWEYLQSSIAWGWGFVLLFPGNILSAMLVEKFLWNKSLTLVQLSALEVPIEIAINATIWLLCVRLWSLFTSKRNQR